MKLNDMYPSNYLKSADVGKSRPIVTIQDVKMEKLGDDTKPVMYFQGKDKAMVLNKTNANTIAYHYGEDTDMWRGRPLELRVELVQGPSGMVEGLRVSVPAQQAPQAAQQPEGQLEDQDIPF